MANLTRHQKRLARFVVGSHCGERTELYLRDSSASGGSRAVRCLGATITALCEAGVLEEIHTEGGGKNWCDCLRAEAAGPAEEVR